MLLRLIKAALFVLNFGVLAPATLALGAKYDCGQPSNSGSGPTSSSALYVLKAAVGTKPCSPCLCDVDHSNTITSTDALLVLKKAVGQSVTLNCPNDDGGVEDQCVECDNSSAVTNAQKIYAALGVNTTGVKHPLVVFRCSGTVPISADRMNNGDAFKAGDPYYHDPEVIDDDVVVDGTGTDGQRITFSLQLACYDACYGYCSGKPSKRCSGFNQCDGDGPCCNKADDSGACTNPNPIETNNDVLASPIPLTGGAVACHATPRSATFRDYPDSDRRFLKIKADNVTVKNMIVTGFGDGIEFGGKDGTVDNVDLVRQCDASITTTRGSGQGGVLKNSLLKQGAKNCAHILKGGTTTYTPGVSSQCALPADSTGTPPNRDCYHLSIFDTDLEGCYTPIKVTADTIGHLAGDGAKLYVSNARATELTSQTDTSSSVFACGGSDLEGNPTTADFVDYRATACDRGLTLGGVNSLYRVKGSSTAVGSEVRSSEIAGLIVQSSGTAKPTLRNTHVFDNGGYKAFTGVSGGVGIAVGSDMDGGIDDSSTITNGIPNKGGNKIACNKQRPESSSSSNADAYNASGKNIKLRGNNWGADATFVVNTGSGSTTNVDAPISDPFGTSNTCTPR